MTKKKKALVRSPWYGSSTDPIMEFIDIPEEKAQIIDPAGREVLGMFSMPSKNKVGERRPKASIYVSRNDALPHERNHAKDAGIMTYSEQSQYPMDAFVQGTGEAEDFIENRNYIRPEAQASVKTPWKYVEKIKKILDDYYTRKSINSK